MTFLSDRAQYRILLLLVAMDGAVKSSDELAAEVGATQSGMSLYLRHIGARVAKWEQRGKGRLTPLYDLLPLPSVRKPHHMTATESRSRYWRSIKADPVWHEQHKFKQRVRDGLRSGRLTGGAIVIDGNVISLR